jgi:hypothetical protein
MQSVFTDNDDLAPVGRGAVVARARYAFAAGVSQLFIVRLVRVVLAHPSYAAAGWAVVFHRSDVSASARGSSVAADTSDSESALLHSATGMRLMRAFSG